MFDANKMFQDVVAMKQSGGDSLFFNVLWGSAEVFVEAMVNSSGDKHSLGFDLRNFETGFVYEGVFCAYNSDSDIRKCLEHLKRCAYRDIVIPQLRQNGVELSRLSEELDYRDVARPTEPHGGWDDDLIDYSTEELELMETLWEEATVQDHANGVPPLDVRIGNAQRSVLGTESRAERTPLPPTR